MVRTLQLYHLNFHLNFPSRSSHLTKGWQPTNPGATEDSHGPMVAMEVMEVTPATATIMVSIPAMDSTLIIRDCRLTKLDHRKMSETFEKR